MQAIQFRRTPERILNLPLRRDANASVRSSHAAPRRYTGMQSLRVPHACRDKPEFSREAQYYVRKLKSQMIGAAILDSTFTLSLIGASAGYLYLHSHRALLLFTSIAVVFKTVKHLVGLYALSTYKECLPKASPADLLYGESMRIAQLLEPLTKDLPAPVQVLPRRNSRQIGSLVVKSGLYVLADFELTSRMSDKELTVQLAHEVSHLKKQYRSCPIILGVIAGPLTYGALIGLSYNLLSTSPIQSEWLKIPVTILVTSAFEAPLNFVRLAIRTFGHRAYEYLMDFNGIKVTRDPETAYRGLKKIEVELTARYERENGKPGWFTRLLTKTGMINSHPKPEKRRDQLLRYFPPQLGPEIEE